MNKTNDNLNVAIGDSFVEVLWSDRVLYKVVGLDGKKIIARRVETEFKNGWEGGTEYPKTDEKGEWLLWNEDVIITKTRNYWKMNGHDVRLSWGETTGYRDPSF